MRARHNYLWITYVILYLRNHLFSSNICGFFSLTIYLHLSHQIVNVIIDEIYSTIVSKYKRINLSNKCFFLFYIHNITSYLNSVQPVRVNRLKHLDINADSSLSFNEHCVYTQNRASSMISFINRSCKDFDSPPAFKSLGYCAFVRSVFDYSSIVRSPRIKLVLSSLLKRS